MKTVYKAPRYSGAFSVPEIILNNIRRRLIYRKEVHYRKMSNGAIAFLMSVLAGLATGIGSCVAFFVRRENKTFLGISLGFSAGVMLYVSMAEMFDSSRGLLDTALGEKAGGWAAVGAFFCGMLFIALIERLIPSGESILESELEKSGAEFLDKRAGYADGTVRDLKRAGVLTAVAIAIHNFPEGLATFVSALGEPSLAVPIVVAIAIHNIPEGIAVSVPVYRATGSRAKAFLYSLLSGLAEPVGALLGWVALTPFMTDTVFGAVYGAVAGIMVFIALDELLPSALEYGHYKAVYGLVCGMAVMAISLMLFV